MAHIFLFAARRLKTDLEHRRSNGHFLLAVVLPHRSWLPDGKRVGRGLRCGEVFFRQFQHRVLLKAPSNRKYHIAWAIKTLIAAAQQGGIYVGDGFLRPGNILPDGMNMVHGLQKVRRNHPLGAVAVHAQLLGNDPSFPADGRPGKIGRRYKVQQHLQRLGKVFGTAKVVGRLIKAGKGIGGSAQRVKALHGIPVGAVEHLVFQVVGHPGGQRYLPAPHPVADVYGAHPDGEHGIRRYKAGHPAHLHGKAAGQHHGAGALSQQLGGMAFINPHRTHPPSLRPAKRTRYPV